MENKMKNENRIEFVVWKKENQKQNQKQDKTKNKENCSKGSIIDIHI